MNRISSTCLTLPLLLAALATACDIEPDAGEDTDGASDTDDSSGDPSGDPSGEDTDDGSTGEMGECMTLAQADIAGPTTLPAGCYDVQTFLSVDAALTLEAGAELRFAPVAGMFVSGGGSLTAAGTAEEPVVFDAESTNWLGLEFLGTASADNQLTGVEILGVDGDAVTLSSSTVAITGSTIAENSGLAVQVDDGSTITISGSTFTQNAGPLEVGVAHVEGLDTDNDFTGNDDDVVTVRSGTVEDDVTWLDVGVPLAMTGNLGVDGDLVFAEGMTLVMPLDASISVATTGSLAAMGSADAAVTIRGAEAQPGYWKGIAFHSKATANALVHVMLENAGSSQWNGFDITNAAVWLPEESKVVISGTTIAESGGAAVMALSGSDLTGFANNTIVDNEESLVLSANLPAYLDGSNTFSNNGDDVIEIYDSSSEDAQLDDDAWPEVGLPYRIMERMYVVGDWTIEPGVEIQVAQDVNINVESTGSVNAVGTSDAPIRIVGVEPLQGYWMGIEIHSVSASNVFDNVELRHGGSDGFNGSEDSDAILFIGGFGGDGSVTLRNSTLSDSGGYGVSVWTDSSLLGCDGVTFTDNAKADVFVSPNGAASGC
ncbi:MAG: right-handed parallel beta-helix repeat-containing protein [Nannocystaceae bacterium]|nr:right-handed parallel beta-helix repeat-containing protein [bacterium]